MKVYKIFQYLWIASIVGFLGITPLFRRLSDNSEIYSQIAMGWLAVFGLGVLFYFLYMFLRVRVAKNKHKAFSRAVIHGAVGTISCIAIIAFLAILNPYNPSEAQVLSSSATPPISQTQNTLAPIPTQKPATVATTVVNMPSEPQITCTGPDGKSFQASQQECDEFNKAWGKTQQAPVQTTTTNKGPTQPTSQLSYPCWDHTYNYYFYTSSGEECNAKNADSLLWNICAENVKNSGEYRSCADQCSATHSYESDICYAAYGDSNAYIEYNWDLYMECSSEVSGNFSSCLSTCQPLYQKDFDKCYKK